MAQVYKDIIRLTIDLKKGVKEAIAPIKQADNLSRVLRCQLINNGKPINLKGSQLLLYVIKTDFKQCVINGVINESKTGIVDFELTEQSLILAEDIQCEIIKIDEGDVLLSFPIFKIGIDGALYDNGLVESTNEFSALTALISNVASWENRFVEECERIEQEFDGKIKETNSNLFLTRNNLQSQINSLVLASGGEDSLEVVQARNSMDGNTYETLNSRINAIEEGVKTNKSPISIEFELGNIDVANGNLHQSNTVLRTKDFCRFNTNKIYTEVAEGYRYRIIAFNSDKGYLWYGDWLTGSNTMSIDTKNYYKFIMSRIDQGVVTVEESSNVVFQYNYGVYDYTVDLSTKIDAPTGYQTQNLDLKVGYVHGTNNVDYGGEGWDYAYAFYNCKPNDKIKVTGYGQSAIYPVLIFYGENNNVVGTYGGVNTAYTDHEVTIPNNCYKVCLNSKDKNSIKLEAMKPYNNLDDYLEQYMGGQSGNNELYFEIENIYKRIERNEKRNDFAWRDFDKTYFAFVIDDCNSSLPYFQELFTELNIPLSSATIIDKLNTTYQTSSGNKTVKEILDLIVANGGEVLAHYNGSLNDSSSDSEWLKVTREVKKTLTQNGYDVRGLIRADSTSNGSYKGEKYCRLYFDYSDGVGSSPQYNIKRWFLMGTTTLEGMKAYINQCVETPGFYPIAFHGNRADEPMATTENMMEVIKYIKSLGDNVEITTYRNVYDRFASSVLENRLSVVEKFLGTIG